MSHPKKSFADYKSEGHKWITLATGEFYPDILEDACKLYQPVLEMFGQLLKTSESSSQLLQEISEVQQPWIRIQLVRIFRKYASPYTPVEMLKRKTKVQQTIAEFGHKFHPVQEVHQAFLSRPMPDEALCALLWEYKDRGKKGYDLTERFFELFQAQYPQLIIEGPKRAGGDIRLGKVFADYPRPKRPVDFVIYNQSKETVLAIGLARYDSDRGGAQEDDRTGGYLQCANEVKSYVTPRNLGTKLIFLNDGPGLLLGSMWDDYAKLEESWQNRIIVVTLRMFIERVTLNWLQNGNRHTKNTMAGYG